MDLRIIDLDASVAAQEPLRRRVDAGAASLVPAGDLAGSLRIVAKRRALAELASRWRAAGRNDGSPVVTFYGSGDFHHVTAGLLSDVSRDVSVVHFDNHPDWVSFPASVNCGAWVNRALEMPHVRKVVTLGPCSDDLVRPETQFANLKALSQGVLEVYPWRHAPSRVWRRYQDGPGHRQAEGHLHWRNLAEEPDWDGFLTDLFARLPTLAVWLTIDKDALAPADAATNWDQGQLPLDKLMRAISLLAETREIVGIDVCGDWSKPRFTDPFRAALAYFDHPSDLAVTDAGLARNAAVNALLLERFAQVLS